MAPIRWMLQVRSLALICLFVTLSSCQKDTTVFSWNITSSNNESLEINFFPSTFNEFFSCLFSQASILCKINILGKENNTASFIGITTNVNKPQSNVTRYICSFNGSEPSVTCSKVNMTQNDEICSITTLCLKYSVTDKTWNNTYELPFVEISPGPDVAIFPFIDSSHRVNVTPCAQGCMFETLPPPPTTASPLTTESTTNETILLSPMTTIASTNSTAGPAVMTTMDTTRSATTDITKSTNPIITSAPSAIQSTMNVSQPPTATTKSTLRTSRSTATAETSTLSSLESSVESTINSDSTQSTNTGVSIKNTETPSASPLPPLSDEPLVSDSSSALTDEQIIIIGLVVGTVIVIAALVILGVILWRRRERSRALLLANDSIVSNTDHKENEIQEDLDGDYSTIEAILRPGTRSLIRDRPTLKFTDTYITNNNEIELKKAMNSLDLNKGITQDNTNPDSTVTPKAPDSSKSEGKGITDVYATINSHTKVRNSKKALDTGNIEDTPDVPPGPQTPDRSASGSSDDSGANDNLATNLMDATESSNTLTTVNGDEKLTDKCDVTTNPDNRYIDYRL